MSSCVFRAVHRCCVLGCCFPLKISLWVSCLHCVGLQHFGEREGLLAASASGKSGCPLCFADASEWGVHARLEVGGVSLFCARFDRGVGAGSEGLRCSQAAVVLAYEAQVTVSVLACLAARLSQYRWCCCLSRCVGVGQGPRSPPAFCRAAGHRAPGGKLHVSLCRCSAFSLSANASL